MGILLHDFIKELPRSSKDWLRPDIPDAKKWFHVAHDSEFPTSSTHTRIVKDCPPSVDLATRILSELRAELYVQGIHLLGKLKQRTLEDGGTLIEFITPNVRLGFTIESDSTESGWYLVSDESAGNIIASGSLAGVSVKAVVDLARGCIR